MLEPGHITGKEKEITAPSKMMVVLTRTKHTRDGAD